VEARLSEPDVRTRLDAVDSLGNKGGDDAIRPLIEATADADYRVRTARSTSSARSGPGSLDGADAAALSSPTSAATRS